MWTAIASLFFGALPTIVESIGKAKKAALDARTEQEKIAANERVKALEAQRDVLIARSGSSWDSLGKFLFAFPFIFYLNWIIVWDKIACKWFLVERSCSTDPLSPWLEGTLTIVLGGFFLIGGLFRK